MNSDDYKPNKRVQVIDPRRRLRWEKLPPRFGFTLSGTPFKKDSHISFVKVLLDDESLPIDVPLNRLRYVEE